MTQEQWLGTMAPNPRQYMTMIVFCSCFVSGWTSSFVCCALVLCSILYSITNCFSQTGNAPMPLFLNPLQTPTYPVT